MSSENVTILVTECVLFESYKDILYGGKQARKKPAKYMSITWVSRSSENMHKFSLYTLSPGPAHIKKVDNNYN